jgi:excisionase family DNA binding protein
MKSPPIVRTQTTRAPEEAKPLEPLLSVVQAARLLNISVPTLRQWLSQRQLPYVKVGRRTMLRPEDIERFIEHNRKEARSFDER